MILVQRFAAFVLAVGLALSPAAEPAGAAAPSAYGAGQVRAQRSAADVYVQLDGDTGLYFAYWEASPEGRSIILEQLGESTCLGELFGGQTIQVTGLGSDSATPGEPVEVQVFLIDGGQAGPDKVSLKVRRSNGDVSFQLPLRELQGGDLQVWCSL